MGRKLINGGSRVLGIREYDVSKCEKGSGTENSSKNCIYTPFEKKKKKKYAMNSPFYIDFHADI